MFSLYIDTHYKEVNIVLFKDGLVLDSINNTNPLQSTVTMPLIDKIMGNNNITIEDIKEIYCVNGPGSFTGVRVGITIAKMLAAIKDIKIKSTDYLEIMSIHTESDSIVAIPDNHGAYVGIFKDYELTNDYRYYNKEEYTELKENNQVIENINIDYKLVYNLYTNKPSLNPHLVNPLYIKNVVK